MFRYEANLINGENEWNLIEGTKNISNNEITLKNDTKVNFLPVNLLHYQEYIIDFELYNMCDNRIEFGIVNGPEPLTIRQDINKTNIYVSNLYHKELEQNVFKTTGNWRNFKIIKKSRKSAFYVENNKYDIDHRIRGMNFYLRKWAGGLPENYIKVKNIKITVLNALTCNCKRKVGLFLPSFIMLIFLS